MVRELRNMFYVRSQVPQRERFHSPTGIASLILTFYWFSWLLSSPLSFLLPYGYFLHLPNNYCAQVLILDQLLGEPTLRPRIKLYFSLASLPDSPAS